MPEHLRLLLLGKHIFTYLHFPVYITLVACVCERECALCFCKQMSLLAAQTSAPAPPLLVGHFKYLQVKLFHCLLHNCSRHTHSMCVCMCVGLGAWVVGEVPASCPEIHLSDALSPRRTEACCLLIKFKFDLLLVSYWISILFSCPFSLSR